MLCINLQSTDPFFNLAVDEYLLKNSSNDFVVLGSNQPSVVIGKHQVAHRESDTMFVSRNGIPVIRRISGGGTVYHDPGNLNFSFILQSTKGRQVDFRKYTLPVLDFLQSKGIDAKFEGKNDLKVNGFKVSGNAEHVYHERVLHHGTLLFSADLSSLRGALRKNMTAYSTRAVDSNPSKVTNLSDLLPGKHFDGFRQELLQFFLDMPGNKATVLKREELSEIEFLADTRYRTWDWNYAYGPEYQYRNDFEFAGAKYSCRFFVKEGLIIESAIEGSGELSAAGRELSGCRHMPADILNVLQSMGLNCSEPDIYNFF